MAEEDLEDVRYWITEEGIKALNASAGKTILFVEMNSRYPAAMLGVPGLQYEDHDSKDNGLSAEEGFQRAFLVVRETPCGPGECHCEDGWLP